MKLLYFAWVKARTGIASEEVAPPAEVADVASLMDWLKARGDNYAAAFEEPEALRIAINQEYARPSDPITASDEIAFFPPVTGG